MSDNASSTPRALRCIISFIGRRNAGKSSLINAFTGQDVAIVSDHPGTTTDAVSKPYELLPLGPVTLYDTAGLDDDGTLGELRIKATLKVLARSDIAVLVCGEAGLGQVEKEIITRLQGMKIPFVIAFNKQDKSEPSADDIAFCQDNKLLYVIVSSTQKQNIDALKSAVISIVPPDFKDTPLLAGDLFSAGETVFMVVPLDLSAPKGRLILPQVQVLREILDSNATAVVVKETDLSSALNNQHHQPSLIISDSQVIKKVSSIVPTNINLTTFSILFARNKGDLPIMADGARKIDALKDGDKILIAEACSHHAMSDDIGKVKIPNWIKQYTGKNINFDFCHGADFPDNLEEYALVIHCGACMLNRAEMLRRLHECVRRGVAITNYGVAISKTQGVLDRVVKVFNL